MAYLDLTDMAGNAAALPQLLMPREETRLSALEWQVVAIAQRDRLSSLEAPGRLSIALGILFGGDRGNPRLADPKLEALRRIAVIAWHRGFRVPQSEIQRFHEAGYTPGQLETLLTSIGRGRAALNQGNHHEHAYAH
ncbi:MULTISPECIES: hypothetical protein [unclassified Sphingomonas]|jgi:hypothetical protein|uniref:hypothetical protein n=1 Tax=unclassified Sphingomonas TaxID=196159 RepID=UPI0002EBB8E6|nr:MULTISPECIES: hypothetical protein [unclassified Sphingomonas]KTF70189.1 hypothetical protein ATB93_05455 [Sphingomonas sp. WG]